MTKQVKKSRGMAAMIFKSIVSRSREILLPLYIALVRPNLEYGNVIWSPHKKKDKKFIEKVQRHFTKRIAGLSKLKYEDRLKELNLPSLAYRRVRGDLIETYKIVHGCYDPITTNNLFEINNDNRTRSHNFKITKPRLKLLCFNTFLLIV